MKIKLKKLLSILSNVFFVGVLFISMVLVFFFMKNSAILGAGAEIYLILVEAILFSALTYVISKMKFLEPKQNNNYYKNKFLNRLEAVLWKYKNSRLKQPYDVKEDDNH